MLTIECVSVCVGQTDRQTGRGSILGPTLFSLFINDISNIFDGLHMKCKLYADDIKL